MMKSSYIRKALLVGCLMQLFQQAAGINTGRILAANLFLKSHGKNAPQRVNFVHAWKNYPTSTNCGAPFLSIDG
jgi:hypothetical protein